MLLPLIYALIHFKDSGIFLSEQNGGCMTEDKTDITKTIKVVTVFLEAKGFDAKKATDSCKDGHWILRSCEAMESSSCLLCVDKWLEALFARLENGSFYEGEPLIRKESDWNRASTNLALHKGGFEKWPEAHE